MFSLTYEWMVIIFSVIIFGLIYSFFILSIESRIKDKSKSTMPLGFVSMESKTPRIFHIPSVFLKTYLKNRGEVRSEDILKLTEVLNKYNSIRDEIGKMDDRLKKIKSEFEEKET